jgi:hypothetical protein
MVEDISIYWATESKHDDLIDELIRQGKFVVYEDEFVQDWDEETKSWRPRAHVLFLDEHFKNMTYRQATFSLDDDGYPRLLLIKKRDGKRTQTWLKAHRIVNVAFEGPTKKEIDHKDRNRENYNRWNLEESDRVRQLANRCYKNAKGEVVTEEPPEDYEDERRVVGLNDDEEIPF